MKKIIIMLMVLCILGLLSSCNLLQNNPLYKALHLGNLERVKEAVDDGADVNKKSSLYSVSECPLLYSINNGQKFIPEYLLLEGADPNYIDNNGISILMYTIGANKEAGLNYANATNNESYKTLLNDKRTDINLTGKHGYTALDYACRDNGDSYVVNYLISHGAKITARTMKCAMEGFSSGVCEASVVKLVFDSLTAQGISYGLEPEFEAAIKGDTSKLRSLFDAGKINEDNRKVAMFLTAALGNTETLKIFTEQNIDLNEEFYFKTLLGITCSYGELETVQYLVGKQVDLERSTSRMGETALTKAIRHKRLDIAEYLLKCGAKFQTFEDSTQQNALEIACENGDLLMVKWIIDSGYPMTTSQQIRAMTESAQYDKVDLLKYFLDEKKFDINAQSYNNTVLQGAAYFASLDTIKFLVDNDANVNNENPQYSSPFDIAVMYNRTDVVKYLIEKGADVNVVGVSSDSQAKNSRPLTKAIQNGYFDMVKLLVENGADIHYKEGWADGKDTALDIAKIEGSKHIIEYIENANKN